MLRTEAESGDVPLGRLGEVDSPDHVHHDALVGVDVVLELAVQVDFPVPLEQLVLVPLLVRGAQRPPLHVVAVDDAVVIGGRLRVLDADPLGRDAGGVDAPQVRVLGCGVDGLLDRRDDHPVDDGLGLVALGFGGVAGGFAAAGLGGEVLLDRLQAERGVQDVDAAVLLADLRGFGFDPVADRGEARAAVDPGELGPEAFAEVGLGVHGLEEVVLHLEIGLQEHAAGVGGGERGVHDPVGLVRVEVDPELVRREREPGEEGVRDQLGLGLAAEGRVAVGVGVLLRGERVVDALALHRLADVLEFEAGEVDAARAPDAVAVRVEAADVGVLAFGDLAGGRGAVHDLRRAAGVGVPSGRREVGVHARVLGALVLREPQRAMFVGGQAALAEVVAAELLPELVHQLLRLAGLPIAEHVPHTVVLVPRVLHQGPGGGVLLAVVLASGLRLDELARLVVERVQAPPVRLAGVGVLDVDLDLAQPVRAMELQVVDELSVEGVTAAVVAVGTDVVVPQVLVERCRLTLAGALVEVVAGVDATWVVLLVLTVVASDLLEEGVAFLWVVGQCEAVEGLAGVVVAVGVPVDRRAHAAVGLPRLGARRGRCAGGAELLVARLARTRRPARRLGLPGQLRQTAERHDAGAGERDRDAQEIAPAAGYGVAHVASPVRGPKKGERCSGSRGARGPRGRWRRRSPHPKGLTMFRS